MTGRWTKPRNVSVCVDTEGWFDPFAHRLVDRATRAGDSATFVRDARSVGSGGIAFYLSCMKLTPPDILARNPHNVVVHASALPHGRGFSPLAWQVLEGRDTIPISMIVAADGPDSGDILMEDELVLRGHELNDEMRGMLGRKIVDMCLRYLALPKPPPGRPQSGEPSWYPRRRPEDSKLDPELSLADQFELLRVVDNVRYPAYFEHRGHRYLLQIERAAVDDSEERDAKDN